MNNVGLAAALAMLSESYGHGMHHRGIAADNRNHRDRLDPRNSVHAPIVAERIAAAEAKRARKNAKRCLQANPGEKP